jgi:hypothetical protein
MDRLHDEDREAKRVKTDGELGKRNFRSCVKKGGPVGPVMPLDGGRRSEGFNNTVEVDDADAYAKNPPLHKVPSQVDLAKVRFNIETPGGSETTQEQVADGGPEEFPEDSSPEEQTTDGEADDTDTGHKECGVGEAERRSSTEDVAFYRAVLAMCSDEDIAEELGLLKLADPHGCSAPSLVVRPDNYDKFVDSPDSDGDIPTDEDDWSSPPDFETTSFSSSPSTSN